jgi:hypothetical protein
MTVKATAVKKGRRLSQHKIKLIVFFKIDLSGMG